MRPTQDASHHQGYHLCSWCLEGSDEWSWGYLKSFHNSELRVYAQVSVHILVVVYGISKTLENQNLLEAVVSWEGKLHLDTVDSCKSYMQGCILKNLVHTLPN